MSYIGYSIEDIIDSVNESDKLKERYLKGNIDKAIADLVYFKRDTKLAFDIYNGIRDQRELQHLVDNYGVGSPMEIPNMRMIARRINVLVGIFLQNNMDYSITSSNNYAIDIKMTKKKNKMLDEIMSQVQSSVDKKKKNPIDEDFIKILQKKYGSNWKADFEIAAYDYIEYFKKKYEFKSISKEAVKNYFITGETYFRVYLNELGTDPQVISIDPKDFFFEKDSSDIDIDKSRRVVHRKYMTPDQVISDLGHYMTNDEREKVARAINKYYNEKYRKETMFIDGRYGEEIAIEDNPRYRADLITVYHVEWKSVNSEKYDTDRLDMVEASKSAIKRKRKEREDVYEGYRIEIGNGIYAGCGKKKYVERSKQDPQRALLSYKGRILNGNKTYTDKPFSFILSTKDISDTYDLTHFHLNNLLASARPGGTYTVLEHLPESFGKTPEERLRKNAGYEKTLSQKLLSLSQEGNYPGESGSIPFNNYGNYPSNLDGSLIEAFMQYLQMLEQQADRVTGLNSRMLGEMEQRDGKAVTAQAIQQGELITKEIFYDFSVLIQKILRSVINLSTISYKDYNQQMFSYSVGDNYKLFQLDEDYVLSDFDVHLVDDFKLEEDKVKTETFAQYMLQRGTELKKTFDYLTSNSLTKKREILEQSDKEFNGKYEDKIKQMEEMIKKMQKENEKLKKDAGQIAQEELKLKQQELEVKKQESSSDIELEKKKIKLREKEIESEVETEKSKVNIEKMQLFDKTKKNDEVNWDK